MSKYADGVEVPSLHRRAKCGKCGGKRLDVRPNIELPGSHAIFLSHAPEVAALIEKAAMEAK